MDINTIGHTSTAPTTTPAQHQMGRAATRMKPASLTLSIEGIGKRFGRDAWGLRDLSLQLSSGVVGLLGPNGAGKSTLMRIHANITKPSTGRVLWNGTDISRSPDTLRVTLGYLPQDFGVYPNLNAVEFLTYMAAIKGLDGKAARRRIDDLLQLLNLTAAHTRRLGGYSGGMKQRVGIAQALLNDPQLLIVDEPTAGLDPEERARFRNLLSELSGERIVILSTHIVSDVEATATTIALMRNGQLQQHAAPETLLRALDGQVWEWVVASADLPALTQQYRFSSQVRRGDGVHVRAVAQSQPSPDAAPVAPNLEDVYLSVIAPAAAPYQNGGPR